MTNPDPRQPGLPPRKVYKRDFMDFEDVQGKLLFLDFNEIVAVNDFTDINRGGPPLCRIFVQGCPSGFLVKGDANTIFSNRPIRRMVIDVTEPEET